MGYITSFTYCEKIQTQMTPKGPKSQIVNPLQVLTPIALPSNYSFAISCGIGGLEEKNNVVRMKFISPNNEIINDTGDISFDIHESNKALKNGNCMQINLDLRNIILKERGNHKMQIIENCNTIGEYIIPVIEGD